MININNCLYNCMYFPFAFWIIYWKSAMIQLSSYVFTSGSSQCNGLSLQKADEREQEGEQRDREREGNQMRERGLSVRWGVWNVRKHLWSAAWWWIGNYDPNPCPVLLKSRFCSCSSRCIGGEKTQLATLWLFRLNWGPPNTYVMRTNCDFLHLRLAVNGCIIWPQRFLAM